MDATSMSAIVGVVATAFVTLAIAGLKELLLLLSPRDRIRRTLARDLPLLEHAPEGDARRRLVTELDDRLRTYVDALENPSRVGYVVSVMMAVLVTLTSFLMAALIVALAWSLTVDPTAEALGVPGKFVTIGAALMAYGFVLVFTVLAWRDVCSERRELARAQSARVARRFGVDVGSL